MNRTAQYLDFWKLQLPTSLGAKMMSRDLSIEEEQEFWADLFAVVMRYQERSNGASTAELMEVDGIGPICRRPARSFYRSIHNS
jgi:hypothetical protein